MGIVKFRKAQLATLMLPIIALILVGISLYLFSNLSDEIYLSSNAVSQILEEINFNERYVEEISKIIISEAIKICSACTQEEIRANARQISKFYEENFFREELGNFFGRIRNNDFDIEKRADKVILKIEKLFIVSKVEKNKIIRNFAICQEFNIEGKFLQKC